MSPPKKYPPLDKTCLQCGAVFHAHSAYAVMKQRFCSRACCARFTGPGRQVTRVPRPCRKCGAEMQLRPHEVLADRQFCSYACSNSVLRSGAGNPAWKGGTGNRGAYWKRAARERDGHRCQFPGCPVQGKGAHIHAHHKIPRAAGGEDGLDNLITLCARHHREIERRLLARLLMEEPAVARRLLEAIYRDLAQAP